MKSATYPANAAITYFYLSLRDTDHRNNVETTRFCTNRRLRWAREESGYQPQNALGSLSELKEIGYKMTRPVHISPFFVANRTTIG